MTILKLSGLLLILSFIYPNFQQEEIVSRKNGHYVISKGRKKDSMRPPVICGTVWDERKEPLRYGKIWVEKPSLRFPTENDKNTYSFTIAPGKYKFIGRPGPGYLPMKTNSIEVTMGDSIRVDYYIHQDTIPLID